LKTYKPGQVKDEDLRRELDAIQQAANRSEPFAYLQVLHAEPARILAGMLVYFDGVDYNPGSGEGVYVRNKDNSGWRFLG
jgi:hypothetical protein